MSLDTTFFGVKKVVQVVQIGRRGVRDLDKIQKNSSFFWETLPKPSLLITVGDTRARSTRSTGLDDVVLPTMTRN